MELIKNNLLPHSILAPIACGLVCDGKSAWSQLIVATQLAHVVSHRFPPTSLPAFAAVVTIFPVLLTVISPGNLWAWSFLSNLAIYLISLGLSITAYRLSPLHPLAKYPGPVLARVSRFWAIYQVGTGQQHLTSHQLFKRYGNVVRTGPNHLIIREAGAIPVLHGSKDRWPRHGREFSC
jgi:hypothetical protein